MSRQTVNTELPLTNRVFVGNLAWRTTWQDLKDHMRQAGPVAYASVLREKSGRSKGCGIVEYETVEDAEKAVRELNDSLLQGRLIFIREDREDTKRTGGGGKPSLSSKQLSKKSGTEVGNRQLYVGNLPYSSSDDEVKDYFSTVGDVESAAVQRFPDGGSKGFALVRYAHEDDAEEAVSQFDRADFEGRRLKVWFDRDA
eukprot:gb/GECH01011560.1/.p1 GENE.gb/GECH01011560.1/~~gb/GECH01011560.1/.p1  ORF type:complete len:199 (+),score=54.27 gb/GECH01011560.1/:1-597(+)